MTKTNAFVVGDIVYLDPIADTDYSGLFVVKGSTKDHYILASLELPSSKPHKFSKSMSGYLKRVDVFEFTNPDFDDLLSFRKGWHELFDDSEPESVIITLPEKVNLTLDKVIALLKEALRQADQDKEDTWAFADLSDLFLFFRLRYSSLFSNSMISIPAYSILPFTNDAALTKFFAKSDSLCDVDLDCFTRENLLELIDYAAYLETLIGKSLIERPLNDEDAKELLFFYGFSGHQSFARSNEEAKEAFFHFLSALEKKNDPLALSIISDSYFLGTDIAPKDIGKSIPYLLELAKTNDSLANARLGLVYLKGLAGKEKDYDKAFKYFSLAMAKQSIFACCMIADMADEGLGIPNDYEMANDLLSPFYQGQTKLLLSGNLLSFFADLAFRKGHYELEGLGVSKDPSSAAYDLLLAQKALKLRDLAIDFPFEEDLSSRIDKDLLKAFNYLADPSIMRGHNDSALEIFGQSFAMGLSVDASISTPDDMRVIMTIKPHKDQKSLGCRFFVSDLTSAEARFVDSCSIEFILPPWADATLVTCGDFHIDKISDTGCFGAFYHGKTLFAIPYDEVHLLPFKTKPSTKKIKVASLQTRSSESIVLKLPNVPIAIGDIVSAPLGETFEDAIVTKIFSLAEDESPIPLDEWDTFSAHGA